MGWVGWVWWGVGLGVGCAYYILFSYFYFFYIEYWPFLLQMYPSTARLVHMESNHPPDCAIVTQFLLHPLTSVSSHGNGDGSAQLTKSTCDKSMTRWAKLNSAGNWKYVRRQRLPQFPAASWIKTDSFIIAPIWLWKKWDFMWKNNSLKELIWLIERNIVI